MATWRRFLVAALTLRLRQPRTHWQVWLSVTALPAAALIVGVGLRLIFRTWPEIDGPEAVVTTSGLALIGARRSLALRRQRRALRQRLTRREA